MKKPLAFALAAFGVMAAGAAVPFKLGVAGFTFHKRTIDDALAIMQKADVHYLCVKDFHLPFSATDADMAAFKEKCAAHGVTPYAIGPVYVSDAAKLREQFEFAKRLGVKTIIGVPFEQIPGTGKDWNKRRGSRALLLEVDKLVKEFGDIRYAIHNHGPQIGELFPDVAYGWELVKDLDPRIGFCIDVGWEYGCDKDPAETIREHGDRIFDAHIKNFEIGKPNGASVPLPRGKIDLASVFKAFAEVGYSGVCSLEYEKDFEDNLLAVVESIGYERGLCDAIEAKAVMKSAPAGANALTDAEKADGWELLWDGATLDGWLAVKSGCKAAPDRGWVVADGTLTMRPVNGITPDGRWFPLPPEDQKLGGGGDIVTAAKYREFAFKFDFRLTKAANSGVKYFYDEKVNNGTCEEYQVLDDAHPDSTKGKDGNRRVAALYDIYPAATKGLVKPLGEWNSGMVVAKGAHVEHWLNGVKVLEYDRGTPEFKAAVKASKYAKWGKAADGSAQDWGETPEGRILLQDHSDSTVSFCNLKVKRL